MKKTLKAFKGAPFEEKHKVPGQCQGSTSASGTTVKKVLVKKVSHYQVSPDSAASKIDENLRKSAKFIQNLRKSMNINENQCECKKINENLRKS